MLFSVPCIKTPCTFFFFFLVRLGVFLSSFIRHLLRVCLPGPEVYAGDAKLSKTWPLPSENSDCSLEVIRVLFGKCCDTALELVVHAWKLPLPLPGGLEVSRSSQLSSVVSSLSAALGEAGYHHPSPSHIASCAINLWLCLCVLFFSEYSPISEIILSIYL